MGIVTKKGDGGTTKMFSGEEVSKADARLDFIGDLDELNCALGLARRRLASSKLGVMASEIRPIQIAVSNLMAEASLGPSQEFKNRLTAQDVADLEVQIVDYELNVDLPRAFSIPGATSASALLEMSRAIARRAERRAVGLKERGLFTNDASIVWLNRLSDYLFILARTVEKEAGVPFDVATPQG